MSSIISKICSNCHKTIEYLKNLIPAECPYCHNKYWDKPMHEFKLFMLQEEYINSGRSLDILGKMYAEMEEYCENIIKKKLKSKAVYDEQKLRDIASDVAYSFIYTIMTKPDYVVNGSFGGILSQYALEPLYSEKTKFNEGIIYLESKDDNNRSLQDSILLYVQNSDNKEKYETNVYDEYSKTHAIDLITDIINIIRKNKEKVLRYEHSQSQGFLFIVAMFLFLNKNKKCSLDDFYEYYGDDLKYYIDETLDEIQEFLTKK